MKTAEIKEALIRKYSDDSWVLCFNVGNDTGARLKGWADAVAVSVWPSRGYTVHGFEIKVSRADFIKELKYPEKSDNVGKFCDFWTLVTPAKLVADHEVPEQWGWMTVATDGRIRTNRAPPRNKPKALTRGFLAALLRRRADHKTNGSRERHRQVIARLNTQHSKEIEQKVKEAIRHLNDRVERNEAWVRRFEAKLGVPFSQYDHPETTADALRLLHRLSSDYGSLKTLRKEADSIIKTIDELHRVPETG